MFIKLNKEIIEWIKNWIWSLVEHFRLKSAIKFLWLWHLYNIFCKLTHQKRGVDYAINERERSISHRTIINKLN